MHIPEGEQNKVSHNQANQPERRKVYVPVPRIAGLALEASQERIVNNGCCSVLYKGADIQQIPPVCNHESIKSCSLGCNHAAFSAETLLLHLPNTLLACFLRVRGSLQASEIAAFVKAMVMQPE